MGESNNRKLTKEDFNNLLKLLINTNGKSLNDLTKEEIDILYDRDIKPLLKEETKKNILSSEKIDNILANVNDQKKDEKKHQLDEYEQQLKNSIDLIYFTHQYILTKENIDKLANKIDETLEESTKVINKKLNKELEFGKTKTYRSLHYDTITRELRFCYTENYVKSMEINNESFIISCDSSLINRVLMYSKETFYASRLKKEIANEFILNPILESFNKNALNEEFKNQKHFKDFTLHDSLYNWISVEKTVSYEGESGTIFIAAPENVWQLFIGERTSAKNKECITFDENTSYAVIASTNINEKEISKLKEKDKIYFETYDYTENICIYKNKEVIKDALKLSMFNYGFFGVNTNFFIFDFNVRDVSKDNVFVIVGAKNRSEEEINLIKQRDYINFETDLSDDLILLYNNKPLAKGTFVSKNEKYCFTVNSIITNKEEA